MSSFGYSVLVLFVAAGLLIGCSSNESSKDNTDQAAAEEPMKAPPADPAQEPDQPADPIVDAEPDQPADPPDPVADAEPDQPAESTDPPAPPESPEPDEPAEPDAPSEPIDPIESAQPGAYDEPSVPPVPIEPVDPVDPVDTPSPKVELPTGPVRVEATKAGLTDIGVDRCAKCHKIQYASWLETEHAKLTPPLDCEACHGPGSEYKSLKIMKDPEASRAAGLVDPSREFCANCHISGWEDELLQRSHAHKTDGE